MEATYFENIDEDFTTGNAYFEYLDRDFKAFEEQLMVEKLEQWEALRNVKINNEAVNDQTMTEKINIEAVDEQTKAEKMEELIKLEEERRLADDMYFIRKEEIYNSSNSFFAERRLIRANHVAAVKKIVRERHRKRVHLLKEKHKSKVEAIKEKHKLKVKAIREKYKKYKNNFKLQLDTNLEI
jgi:hypothetical protein